MAWSLFNEKNEKLKPLVFSNGKSQEDIVNEVVAEIKKGTKIIFIRGVCGSGKSAVALNIAKEIGKTSIVVPIKNLQRQYENDYMRNMYVLKEDKEKLKISMITGRVNHECPYLQENKKEIIETRIKEKNSTIFDIFPDKNENNQNENSQKESRINRDNSCDNLLIPCKIEIKNKNLATLKKYYKENPEKSDNSELDVKIMKRMAIAPACGYWSPILKADMKIKNNWQKKTYKSIVGEHAIYLRKNGCPYYNQFQSYIDSDVIIFNGTQYILETALGRKPQTKVEIIDECDEFLDSFALEGTINLSRLRNELLSTYFPEDSQKKLADDILTDLAKLMEEAKKKSEERDNVSEIEETKAFHLLKALAKSDLYEIMADDSYLEHCFEISKKFYDVLSETYANFYQDNKNDKKDLIARFVTINLDKLLNSLIEKNKAFVFMSGTIHNETVLKEIFGLKNFKIIDAETFNQGTITKSKTGMEKDFKFDNFTKGRVNREQYLKALDKCVAISQKPTVIQVSAFQDIPSKEEVERFELKNLIFSEELIEQQKQDKEGRLVKEFKEGKTKVLFTTRCSRGIDFPFSTCNSVVITKFPYPNTQSLFWRILKKQKPQFFWDFYKDKAHRELLQRVYRSVRAPSDHVFLLSPDIRVLDSKVV